jgi:hypothetical protein
MDNQLKFRIDKIVNGNGKESYQIMELRPSLFFFPEYWVPADLCKYKELGIDRFYPRRRTLAEAENTLREYVAAKIKHANQRIEHVIQGKEYGFNVVQQSDGGLSVIPQPIE